MVLPVAHLSYQHARSLPKSRHAVRDADWLAGIFRRCPWRVVSPVALVLDRFGRSPILGAYSRSASVGSPARCPATDRRSAQSEGTISRQYLYTLRMTPARTHKAHVNSRCAHGEVVSQRFAKPAILISSSRKF
jgi:hypothetical protein